MSEYLEFKILLQLPKLQSEPNMFTNTESWAPHTGAVTTFPKSHIIECFFNMVAVSKRLGLAFKTKPLPAVGRGRKKASQVKFKDVFLLDARLCCHKPRETFSYSTFFMVSLRVSSLPFSLHLGSRVYLLLYWPADHSQQGTVGQGKPCCEFLLLCLNRSSSPWSGPGCPWMALRQPNPQREHNLDTTIWELFHRPPQTIPCLHTHSQLMANGNWL